MARRKHHVAVERHYAADPNVVWEIYTDHGRWSEWSGIRGSHLVRKGSPDPNGVGAVRGFMGRTREEILSFDPPKHMTYTVIGGLLPIANHLGEVVLEADDAGTILRWRCHFESKIPGFGGPFQAMITRIFTRALAGLEEELVSRGSTAPRGDFGRG